MEDGDLGGGGDWGISVFFFLLRPGAGGALIVLIELDSSSSSQANAPNDLPLCVLVEGIRRSRDTAWDTRRRGAADHSDTQQRVERSRVQMREVLERAYIYNIS